MITNQTTVSTKRYTSWGEAIEVVTKDGRVYDGVILCPDPNDDTAHLLEYYNGDVVRVPTHQLHCMKREGYETYYIEGGN